VFFVFHTKRTPQTKYKILFQIFIRSWEPLKVQDYTWKLHLIVEN